MELKISTSFLVTGNDQQQEYQQQRQQYGEECLHRRHSSPYCCWSLWWISADGTFSTTRNLITMRCSTLRGTFCSLITLATPRRDWTGSNPSRREDGGCGFTLSRSHSCWAVRLIYTQISPGHIWTTLYTVRHFCPVFSRMSKQISVKLSNIKFNAGPFYCSSDCHIWTNGQTVLGNLIGTVLYF